MEMVIDTYGHTGNDSFFTFHLFSIERLFTKGNERFGLHEPWGFPKGKELTPFPIKMERPWGNQERIHLIGDRLLE